MTFQSQQILPNLTPVVVEKNGKEEKPDETWDVAGKLAADNDQLPRNKICSEPPAGPNKDASDALALHLPGKDAPVPGNMDCRVARRHHGAVHDMPRTQGMVDEGDPWVGTFL